MKYVIALYYSHYARYIELQKLSSNTTFYAFSAQALKGLVPLEVIILPGADLRSDYLDLMTEALVLKKNNNTKIIYYKVGVYKCPE